MELIKATLFWYLSKYLNLTCFIKKDHLTVTWCKNDRSSEKNIQAYKTLIGDFVKFVAKVDIVAISSLRAISL